MMRPLEARGPDASGSHVDPKRGFMLAHRRLSILDLSGAGAQPMVDSSGRCVIAFNGMIYNAEALRAELGGPWRGHSDTEVLLELLARVGVEAALPRLVGMFAFALFDQESEELWLVRDRLGIKPLCWAEREGGVIFASTVASLMAHARADAVLDPDTMTAMLRFGFVPGARTILRGVHKVLPGEAICFGSRGAARRVRWWTPGRCWAEARAGSTVPATEDEAIESTARLIDGVVAERLLSDVPLGAFLSGGIDSSTVVAAAQAASPRPLQTFTIGFRDAAYDESRAAEAIARHLGTNHQSHILDGEEAAALAMRMDDAFDEPFGDASQLPTWLVSRLARQSVSVALSGDGGDELFAGYARHHWGGRLQAGRTELGPLAPLAGAVIAGVGRSPLGASLGPASQARLIRAGGVLGLGREGHPHDGFLDLWAGRAEGLLARKEGRASLAPEIEAAMAGAPSSLSPQERLMLGDLASYLPDDLMVKTDRASMAHGLEVRVPLLDHRLVAHAMSLPGALRARDGRGKYILRRVLERRVPRALFDRPKQGFTVPLESWLRGPLGRWADELLDPAMVRAQGLFRPEAIAGLHRQIRQGRGPLPPGCWALLMFQSWWRRHEGIVRTPQD